MSATARALHTHRGAEQDRHIAAGSQVADAGIADLTAGAEGEQGQALALLSGESGDCCAKTARAASGPHSATNVRRRWASRSISSLIGHP